MADISLLINLILLFFWGLFVFLLIKIDKNIYKPRVFFPFIWFLLLAGVTIITPTFKMNPISIIWIQISCLSVVLGASIVKDKKNKINIVIIKKTMIEKTVKIVIFCLILGTLAPIISIYEAGYSISSITDFESLSKVGIYYSSRRYTESGYREPILHTLFSVFIYLGGFLGGFLFVYAKGKNFRVILSFLTLIPALLVTLILTTKASFLFTGSFWLASYVSTMIFKHRGKIPRLKIKQILLFGVLGAIALIVYSAGHLLRTGDILYGLKTLYASITTAFLGSISAFSMWFSDNNTDIFIPIGFGSRIFAGPFGIFLNMELPRFESVVVGTGMLYEETTIHTLFREAIYDYSLFGSLLFFLLLGLLGRISYQKVTQGNLIWMGILTTYYSFTIISFIGSPFKYNTIILASVLYVLFLFFVSKKYLASQCNEKINLNYLYMF